MLNHLHIIVSSPNVAGFVRDFKKFTSKEFKSNLEQTEFLQYKLFFGLSLLERDHKAYNEGIWLE